MAVVVPLTSTLKIHSGCPAIVADQHIILEPGESMPNGTSVALCHQIRSVDINERFRTKHGQLTRVGMAAVENAVAWVLNMTP